MYMLVLSGSGDVSLVLFQVCWLFLHAVQFLLWSKVSEGYVSSANPLLPDPGKMCIS